MQLWSSFRRPVVACVAMCGLWIACLAAQTPPPKAAVVVSYADARFKPLNPSIPNSAEIAALRGDPDQGPSTMLMKMRRGAGRLHEHTADYELIVIEGTMKHWRAGENQATAKPSPMAIGKRPRHAKQTSMGDHERPAADCCASVLRSSPRPSLRRASSGKKGRGVTKS